MKDQSKQKADWRQQGNLKNRGRRTKMIYVYVQICPNKKKNIV